MTGIYDCDAAEWINKASEELKKNESIEAPDWAMFVKTGMHKERPPANRDWWYVRAASVLKQVYKNGPIGVSKLRIRYGGKKNRGVKPERFYIGSGNILRKILQQLEKGEFVKTDLKSEHKGRVLTAKGKKFLNEIAGKVSKITIVKEEKKEPEAKQEIKKETKQETTSTKRREKRNWRRTKTKA